MKYRDPDFYEEKMIDDLIDLWHDHPGYALETIHDVLKMTLQEYTVWVEQCLIPEDWHLR